MPRMEYKGSTPAKDLNRFLVWLQHRNLLGDATFYNAPHVFLASRYAGDVATLKDLGVPMHNVWAVENDQNQYRHLFDRQEAERFALFTEDVENVLQWSDKPLPSVYLDLCGNLQGTVECIAKVVSRMKNHAALSVTLFNGREADKPQDREAALTKRVKDHTEQQVTLVQQTHYRALDKTNHGASMSTYTYYFGQAYSRATLKFDLTQIPVADLRTITKSPSLVSEIWESQLRLSKTRSRAAVQANVTRRIA
jgi:hypothetical protein